MSCRAGHRAWGTGLGCSGLGLGGVVFGHEEDPTARQYPFPLPLLRGPGGACPLSPICSAGLASFPFC